MAGASPAFAATNATPANFDASAPRAPRFADSARLDYRLLHPQLRTERAAPRRQVSWALALDHAVRFADTIRAYGPDSVASFGGPVADRGLLRLQQAGQRPDRHQQPRHQLAPLHVLGGRRLQADALAPMRHRCSYEDIDHAECILIAGSNTAVAHPSSSPYRGCQGRKPEPAHHRRRSAPQRNLRHRRSASAARAGSDIALYNAMLQVMLKEGPGRPRLHRSAHRRLRRWRISERYRRRWPPS